jgi:ATP-dependent Lon protease
VSTELELLDMPLDDISDIESNDCLENGVYPVLALRDVVIFPGTVAPLFVGRPSSIAALDHAMTKKDNAVMLLTQKDAEQEEPSFAGLYDIGCLGVLLQILKMQDGTVKVLVEGKRRAKVSEVSGSTAFLSADVTVMASETVAMHGKDSALGRTLMSQFEQFIGLNKKMPGEVINAVANIDDLGRLIDTIASHMPLAQNDKQTVLEYVDVTKRGECLLGLLEAQISMILVERKIHQRVKQQMDTTQLKFYLAEKLSAVQEELKEIDGSELSDIEGYEKKILTLGLSEEAQVKAKDELDKLKMMPPMSSEATVVRHYLDCLLALPWNKRSKINKNIDKAQSILDKDHYGLNKVKERILEYLAVEQRTKKLRGPILCLVGPPGVGKTSLGESIARATKREFVRLSLGGVRDESEIRGHRKTYIGAMPGKILQKLALCKKNNPLFMLDEIDKMGMDFRGDPASAMLEVLDPSQNHSFNDHYIEVDFDLTGIMFIATANSMDIPHALLDRMEIIHLSGYTEREKIMIAKNYLIDKQLKQNGLKAGELTFTQAAIAHIIRHYTHEAGVRDLERRIEKIARKIVRKLISQKYQRTSYLVTAKNIVQYLGVKAYSFDIVDEEDRIGQVTGLAWTEFGGDILTLEAALIPGKGNTSYTGSLGDVMQESIKAALTVIKSRSQQFNLQAIDFETNDIHVHVPEGATPKDGPSAGIGMCVALASAFSRIPVRSGIAMTGEITLRGAVLPIGGLKEKLLAALRSQVKHVIIPHKNIKDLKEVPKDVLEGLIITPVKWIDEVFVHALQTWPIKMDVTAAKPTTIVPSADIESSSDEKRSH